MDTPLFSIIVPMYGTERFVARCIESICSQTLTEIEIILVDDGSPDRCGEIADSYALADARIRVIHKENGGAGPARNSGLKLATGKFVAFVDSDDWVEPCMYERLYKAAVQSRSQIVYSGIKIVTQDRVTETREHPLAGRTLIEQSDIFELRRAFFGPPAARVDKDVTPTSACVAGYDRRLLEEHGVIFRNIFGEDKVFNIEATRCADRIACIPGAFYCYRKDGQPSRTTTFVSRKIDDYQVLFGQLRMLAEEEPEAFRDESRIRAKRCVIDYSRVLIRMLELSPLEGCVKARYVREICRGRELEEACLGFPFWKLPLAQSAFFLCLRFRLGALARALVRLKSLCERKGTIDMTSHARSAGASR